jgi:hypothetical protein
LKNADPTKIGLLPDTQLRAAVPNEHMAWAARYFVAKRPGTIIHLGDNTDCPSISYHNRNLEREGQRFVADLRAGREGLRLFYEAMNAEDPSYEPDLIFLTGNHEDRINRLEMEHTWFSDMLEYCYDSDGVPLHPTLFAEYYWWKVIPFLEVVRVGGIAFSHYFPTAGTGRAIGGNAHYKLAKIRESFWQGHVQGRDIAFHTTPTGRTQIGGVTGSFYQHDEPYISRANNRHWRGIVLLHEVEDGSADIMTVSLDYLRGKYGG